VRKAKIVSKKLASLNNTPHPSKNSLLSTKQKKIKKIKKIAKKRLTKFFCYVKIKEP
jgi:hypothetical protein